MSWLDRLERRLGWLAIPNLTILLIASQVVVLLMTLVKPELRERLELIPQKVLEGDLIRLLTFVAVPPFDISGLLWAFFAYYFFYFTGTALENRWGAFRYTLYLAIGYLATVGAAFLAPEVPASNGFLMGSVMLAFACLYPEFEIRIFFVLPVKMKYLAMLAGAGYVLALVVMDLAGKVLVLASVANFLIFFSGDLLRRLKSARRRTHWQRKLGPTQSGPRHRCVVCGIDSDTHPDMDFRYCTQCEGDCAYCEQHLRNHQHVVAGDSSKNRPGTREPGGREPGANETESSESERSKA